MTVQALVGSVPDAASGPFNMERKIDGLVNQIYQEGIEKARAEAETIVSKARLQAEELAAQSRAEADGLVRRAREEAEATKRNAIAELKLASDQAESQLRSRLQNLLSSGLLKGKVEQALLDVDFVKRVVLELVRSWGSGGAQGGIEITLAEATRKELGERLAASLGQELGGLEATFSNHVRSGFTISRKGDSYQIDFTDAALLEFFQGFLKPKTVELLFGARAQ